MAYLGFVCQKHPLQKQASVFFWEAKSRELGENES